mmetsp:Transcript_11164/g.27629  ORF Transcript_11164/g.27629 Transcript_11164/m.27629 type:complete len:207 (-) Transcript_11164:230-850(-)
MHSLHAFLKSVKAAGELFHLQLHVFLLLHNACMAFALLSHHLGSPSLFLSRIIHVLREQLLEFLHCRCVRFLAVAQLEHLGHSNTKEIVQRLLFVGNLFVHYRWRLKQVVLFNQFACLSVVPSFVLLELHFVASSSAALNDVNHFTPSITFALTNLNCVADLVPCHRQAGHIAWCHCTASRGVIRRSRGASYRRSTRPDVAITLRN